MQFSITTLVYSIGYLIAIIAIVVWFWKIKKNGGKISLTAKIFAAFMVLSGPSVIAVILSPSPSPVSENPPSVMNTYYVKPDIANVRECPSTSCKILSTLSQNTELAFPGDLFDKYPDWAEVTFPDGKVGYVSKTVLSSETQAGIQIEIPPQPLGNEIFLGEGDFDPLEIGYSYEFSFCVPESARSGATCGGLAGETSSPVGGSPPYSISKASGFLPPGMTLELNGRLSGSPTLAGTYNFKLCAKDLAMNQGCEDYVIVVKEGDESGSSPFVSDNSEEILSKGATIDELSCSWTTIGQYEYGGRFMLWTGHARGTATGPAGTDFWLSEGYSGVISCGGWDADPENLYCRRGSGQPAQTHWSVTWEGSHNLVIEDGKAPGNAETFKVKGLGVEAPLICTVN